MYDNCASQQDTKQKYRSVKLLLDPTKYIHCNNICQPKHPIYRISADGATLVDVESDLTGRTKLASRC